MNLEDYFSMLHKMAQKHPQSSSDNHGPSSNNHQDNDSQQEDEDPLPVEDIGDT